MDNTNTPVLVIPDISEFQGLTDVLYLTEFTENDSDNINRIFQLFSDININIHCLHLNLESRDKSADELIEKLKLECKNDQPVEKLSFYNIKCKHPQDVVETFIQLKNIKLIVFVPHKRSSLSMLVTSDLTRRDLFQTKIPILAIS